MDQRLPQLHGADEVRVVAAYHDLDEGKKDLKIAPHEQDEAALGKLGFVIAQELLVPSLDDESPRSVVLRAAELSRRAGYRQLRAEFYEWQESTVDKIVRGRRTIEGAVAEMQGYVKELNRLTAASQKRLVAKAVLTLVGVALPFVLGHETLSLAGAIPGVFELVKFAGLEIGETPAKNKCEAAAMLVAARKALG